MRDSHTIRGACAGGVLVEEFQRRYSQPVVRGKASRDNHSGSAMCWDWYTAYNISGEPQAMVSVND